MASIKEIYEQILEAKEAESYLSDLDSTAGESFNDFVSEMSSSRAAAWKIWVYIVAVYLWLFDSTDAAFKEEVDYWASKVPVNNLRWYRETTLNFLMGKPLVWKQDQGRFVQELLPGDDEEALKIVKYCAVTKSPNKLNIKVATDDNGSPGTLTAPQELAVVTYLQQIAVAGDDIDLINQSADLLNIDMDVYVDPLVIDLNTGELHNDPGTTPVQDAIDAYLLNLEFNGRLTRNAFIDAIQQASGVTDVDLNVFQAKYAAFPYSDIDVSVVAFAGYFKIGAMNINYLPAQ